MPTTTIPANGTKAAVAYWARRVRESLRDTERHVRDGNYGLAEVTATDAAGEAGELEIAARGLALAEGA